MPGTFHQHKLWIQKSESCWSQLSENISWMLCKPESVTYGPTKAQKPRQQGSILRRRAARSNCDPDKMNSYKSFIFKWYDFNTVWTDSLLSGRFENCPDGLKTVRTVYKLFGFLRNCPDGLETVRTVWKLSVLFRRFCFPSFCCFVVFSTELLVVPR